nr:hypothetical protein [Tanacetum cinerariifolium]
MCFNSSTVLYCCELDEQWFNLHKDVLRDALDITSNNDNNPYEHVAKYQQYLDAEHGKAEEGGPTESLKATNAAHDLLTLLTPKNKSPVDQFIFHRCTPMLTTTSGQDKSPSLDVKLALANSETESNNVASKINTGDQDEGQDGPNPSNHDEGQARPKPSVQDEGQVGSNPGDAEESQPKSIHVVHAGPNLEHMDLKENLKLPSEDPVIPEEPASSTRTLDLPTVDMKEILQQRLFEDKSYEAHEDHKKLYDALENSLEYDYSDQHLSDQEEARQKKRKRRDLLRTPFGSPSS